MDELTIKYQVPIAKTIAKAKGWTGRPGGWIYTEDDQPICQGWAALATALFRAGYVTDDGTPRWRRMDLSRHLISNLRAYAPTRTAATR